MKQTNKKIQNILSLNTDWRCASASFLAIKSSGTFFSFTNTAKRTIAIIQELPSTQNKAW